MIANRADYIAEVTALAARAIAMRADGIDEETIARLLVAERNRLKSQFRSNDPAPIVALMEARNLAKYGDPVGPGPEWFFNRYGTWSAVIEAACRTADLS